MAEPKWAIVTGASSGIGREFAVQLASNGYRVTGVARREDQLQQLMNELPGEHDYLVADLATPEGLTSVTDLLGSSHCNLFINNAGFSTFEPFYESSVELQKKILDVNCGAAVCLAHAFLKQSQSGDALINLSSVVAYLPTPVQPMYSASKAFLATFSECLWHEQRPRGVYVMGLCPGVTETEFITNATAGESDGQTLPAMMVQTTRQVVEEALLALGKRQKSIILTGWPNKLMMLMTKILSRHQLIRVLGAIGDPEKAM